MPWEATFDAPAGLFRQFQGEVRRISLPRTRVNRGLGIKNRAYTTSRQAYPNKNGALEGPVLIWVSLPTGSVGTILDAESPIHPSAWKGNSANFALKLSEKSRRRVKRGLPGHRSGTVRPVSAPIYRPNPRSERCSYPFSDSFFTEFSEVRLKRQIKEVELPAEVGAQKVVETLVVGREERL